MSIHCFSWNKRTILVPKLVLLIVFSILFRHFCVRNKRRGQCFLDGMLENELSTDFQWWQENANPRVHPYSGKLGKLRFPLEQWTLGLDFPVPIEHQWWILFITAKSPVLYGQADQIQCVNAFFFFFYFQQNLNFDCPKLLNFDFPLWIPIIPGGKLIVAEERKEGKVGWSVYSAYMKAAGGYVISTLVIITFILSIGAQTMTNWWLSYWLNQGSGVGICFFLENLCKRIISDSCLL